MTLECITKQDTSALYRMPTGNAVNAFIATTPETRAICNDPRVAGVEYTDNLCQACSRVFQFGKDLFGLVEDETVIVNILRGGLNFGLRKALHTAFGWNTHTSCFISAQRARNTADSEEWHITENAYRKVYFPRVTSLVIGDVVATGTSLRYALNELLNTAQEAGTQLKDITFFTYGGPKALEILTEIDTECRDRFPGFQGTNLIFLEGCFAVPTPTSELSIRLTGTDLVRKDAVMAPEFIESQYEDPTYPIERCTIYDAGSRACWVREYAQDVCHYWKQVLNLADRGISYTDYLAERFPGLNTTQFGEQSLRELALRQLSRMKPFLP